MDTVPARIVLMGTSKMSLHERFSKISRVSRAPSTRSQTGYRSADHDYRDEDPQPFLTNDQNEYVYEDEFMEDGYSPQYRLVRPRQHFVRLSTPLRNRVNFPPYRPNNGYFNSPRGIARRNLFSKPRPRVFRPVKSNGSVQNNRFNADMKPRRNMSGGRGRGRGSRGRGNFNGNKFKREPVTHEDLDKELDAYMKKGKHPHIDVSDLMQS